mmetsp:Transcript_29120/g.52684  ORF Transcript_29120/g.52684 Transcript_29120/m.52684 type:complete len:239 (+) Transcript_29120:500-1216(+)
MALASISFTAATSFPPFPFAFPTTSFPFASPPIGRFARSYDKVSPVVLFLCPETVLVVIVATVILVSELIVVVVVVVVILVVVSAFPGVFSGSSFPRHARVSATAALLLPLLLPLLLAPQVRGVVELEPGLAQRSLHLPFRGAELVGEFAGSKRFSGPPPNKASTSFQQACSSSSELRVLPAYPRQFGVHELGQVAHPRQVVPPERSHETLCVRGAVHQTSLGLVGGPEEGRHGCVRA